MRIRIITGHHEILGTAFFTRLSRFIGTRTPRGSHERPWCTEERMQLRRVASPGSRLGKHQGQTETRVFQMLEHAFFNIHELLSEGQASETGAGTLGILGGTWTTHRRLSLLGCLWMPPRGSGVCARACVCAWRGGRGGGGVRVCTHSCAQRPGGAGGQDQRQ